MPNINPITLSPATRELCDNINQRYQELAAELAKLNDAIITDTNGRLSVCTGYTRNPVTIQLFDEHNHPSDVLDALRYSAAELHVKWQDPDETCYEVRLQDYPFIIVLDNTAHSEPTGGDSHEQTPDA